MLDIFFNVHAGEVADHGHHELKEPEMEREAEIVPDGRPAYRHPGRYRNGKGVHGKGNSDDNDRKDIHRHQ
jgi:hypothetical protein